MRRYRALIVFLVLAGTFISLRYFSLADKGQVYAWDGTPLETSPLVTHKILDNSVKLRVIQDYDNPLMVTPEIVNNSALKLGPFSVFELEKYLDGKWFTGFYNFDTIFTEEDFFVDSIFLEKGEKTIFPTLDLYRHFGDLEEGLYRLRIHVLISDNLYEDFHFFGHDLTYEFLIQN
jgi:hypothetical protein